MLLNSADMIAETRLFAGGQHRFSLPGTINFKKRRPLIEGLFFVR
ncbi:hypothetical protein [Erwinia psidii]|nr:hypothetical protein [Erwinia psidii]